MKILSARAEQEVTTARLFETNIHSPVPKIGLAVTVERKSVTTFAAPATEAASECYDAESSITESSLPASEIRQLATDRPIQGISSSIFGTKTLSALVFSAKVLTFPDSRIACGLAFVVNVRRSVMSRGGEIT